MSIVTLLDHLRSANFAMRPALKGAQGEWSHECLLTMAGALIAALQARGVRPGDTVLIAGDNSVEHVVAQLAVPAMGAISIPLALPVADERLQWIIETAQPRLNLVVGAGPMPDSLGGVRLALQPNGAGIALTPPSTHGKPHSAALPECNHASPACVRFTSGSTGRPKGVVLSHSAMLCSARTLAGFFSLDVDHRELLLVSIASSGGWQRVAATLYAGGCVCIGEGPLTLPGLREDFTVFAATGFFSPPPLIRMLLQEDREQLQRALKHCRTIEIGSAPIDAAEVQALLKVLPAVKVYVHYGLTECSRATLLDAGGYPQHLQTCGLPSPGTLLQVRDEQGHALPAGETGQIFVRGPQMASGYWREQDLTDAHFRAGWMATGDYGKLDADGFLAFAGRRDDMINCAGHCFFPEEVERELGTVEGVQAYLVIGMPDPRGVLHEVPWLFAVPDDAEEWNAALLLRQARRRLPSHMRPRHVVVVPQLALTTSGKPDRRGTVALFRTTRQQQ